MMRLGILLVFIISWQIHAQTGIGTNTPHTSAKLEVNSTNKGFLPPRVTLTSVTDAATISSPATGLLVYNVGSAGLQAGYYYWNGSSWSTIATAASPDQSVDYIQASLSANQSLSSAGNISFNVSSGAGITLNSGGFNLIANKTYRLEAALGGSSGGFAYYGWVDSANTLLPGGSIGVIMKAGSTYSDAPQDKAVVFFTPTANTTVFLRVLNVSGGVVAYAPPAANNFSSTWATIQQIGSSAIVNPWTLSGTNTYTTTGNVGIGTTTPNASALLDLSSTTQGVLFPRMTASQRAAISNPVAGLIVYQTNANPGNYVYNGTSWDVLSNANYGDIKTGIQTVDHNGWIRLNGRLKSTLSASQQAQANLLGIGANLPNATNAFLVQNGTALGSVSGSNTITIAQNQLPNVFFEGSIINVAHGAFVQASASGVFSRVNGNSSGNASGGGVTNNLNLSIPLNGGVPQQVVNITPQSLSVNTFIFLGF
jgi:hypothetical protein